jgi:hypothetical protein
MSQRPAEAVPHQSPWASENLTQRPFLQHGPQEDNLLFAVDQTYRVCRGLSQ